MFHRMCPLDPNVDGFLKENVLKLLTQCSQPAKARRLHSMVPSQWPVSIPRAAVPNMNFIWMAQPWYCSCLACRPWSLSCSIVTLTPRPVVSLLLGVSSDYWSNLPCDWPSTAWAYSDQGAENGPRTQPQTQRVGDMVHRKTRYPLGFDRDRDVSEPNHIIRDRMEDCLGSQKPYYDIVHKPIWCVKGPRYLNHLVDKVLHWIVYLVIAITDLVTRIC